MLMMSLPTATTTATTTVTTPDLILLLSNEWKTQSGEENL